MPDTGQSGSDSNRRRLFAALALPLVALIAVSVAFVALCMRTKTQASLKTCTNNLKRLDSIAYNLSLELDLPAGSLVATTLAAERGWFLPSCPFGGTYSGLKFGEKPSCSIHGTLQWDPVRNETTAGRIKGYRQTPFGKEKEYCLILVMVFGCGKAEDVDICDAAVAIENRFHSSPYVSDRIVVVRCVSESFVNEQLLPFEHLFRMACTDADDVVKQFAFAGLVGSKCGEAEALVGEMLSDSNNEVRAIAVQATKAISARKGMRYYDEQCLLFADRCDEYYRQRYDSQTNSTQSVQ